MINKISVINNKNYMSKISFKSSEQSNPIEMKNSETSNLQAKANYGIAQIKISKLMDLKPSKSQLMESKHLDDYEGVKIYNSEGKLAGIIDKNDKTTTYYFPNLENNSINRIEIIDNKTNKIVYRESAENFKDDEYIYVEEFSPITGKKNSSTNYKNGKIISVMNYSNSRNGSKIVKSYYMNDKSYRITEANPRTNKKASLRFSENFKHTELNESFEKGNVRYEKNATFYDGALISTYETKDTVIPNMVGREPLENPNLIPAKRINPSTLSNAMKDGEKTYYSNGAIENITRDDMFASYDLQGNLKIFKTENKEYMLFDDGSQEIREDLGENITKTTIYDTECDDIIIRYKNNDNLKVLHLDSKFKIKDYDEYTINGDKEIWDKSYCYQNGMLINTY